MFPRTLLVLAAASLAPAAQQGNRPVINGGLPSVSPAGDVIAFTSNRDGSFDVYVTTVDGQRLVRISDSPAIESAPFWTADARLVYSVWADTVSTVYAASAQAQQPMVIGTAAGRSPVISPDGATLLYSRGQYPNLTLVAAGLDGSNARELTKEPAMMFNAVYSPDQKQIAYARADSTRQLQLWVMNADGSGARQLTRFGAEDGSPQWPAWSPDGSRLAIQSGRYNRQNPSENTAHVWVVDVKSGAATKLNPHTRPYLDETPSWFPDGRRIAFQSDRTGRMEVWVMNADGSGATQVTR